MLETIKAFDESLFLTLNAWHNLFFDQAMWLFSNKIFWGPLYVWLLWLLYKKFPKHYWTVIVTIMLMIVVSDQLSNLSKDSFMRLRPTHELHLQGLIHTVNGYTGGMYGFYSGHASNSFAVAMFLIYSVSKGRKYIIPVALVYALLTSYSRIYLGVHYPGDVVTGIIIGGLLGTGFAAAHKKLRLKYLKLQEEPADNKENLPG